jgi:hypothetical protein
MGPFFYEVRMAFNFDLEPEWVVTEPGILNLCTTDVSVAYHPTYGVYYITWKGKAVNTKGMHYSLESAKEFAISHVHDLLRMGYEP